MPPPEDARTLPSTILGMLKFRLHFPVVANFLRHRTRRDQSRIFGCLVGTQHGRKVEIIDSFDLPLDSVSGSFGPTLLEKGQCYNMLSPRYRVLGWYSTGRVVEDTDMQIHKTLMEATGGAFYLLLNPGSKLPKNELHMNIYESVSHGDSGSSELTFVKSNCTVEAVASERISIHDADDGEGCSELPWQKYPWTFRKMLLETSSGFAMFDVADRLLVYPEQTWTWFVNPNDSHKVVVKLGFIKVENKSLTWNAENGPGKDLSNFIQKFSFSKPLIVSDAQLQYVIEKKLSIRCYYNAYLIDEIKWGINFMLPEFLPLEKNITNECNVSEQLKKKLKAYGISVSSHVIDRDIIIVAGRLYNMEITSKTYSGILLCKFGHYFDEAEAMSHLDLAKAVAEGLRSKKMVPVDEMCSKEEIMSYINYILFEAPEKIKDTGDLQWR